MIIDFKNKTIELQGETLDELFLQVSKLDIQVNDFIVLPKTELMRHPFWNPYGLEYNLHCNAENTTPDKFIIEYKKPIYQEMPVVNY